MAVGEVKITDTATGAIIDATTFETGDVLLGVDTSANQTVRVGKALLDTVYQALDADLTAIAGLSPANDDIIQRKAGAWINRTMAQLAADLVSPLGSTFLRLDASNDPLTAGLSIEGSANETQLSAKSAVGQTADPFVLYDSGGNALTSMSYTGSWGIGSGALQTFKLAMSYEPDGSTTQGMITANFDVSPTVSGSNESRAMQFVAFKKGTFNHGTIVGVRGFTGLRGGSGTLAATYGGLLGVQITDTSAGTITNGYGLGISSPVRDAGSTTATIGTLYGVRIETQGASYVTNAYGLYIANQSGAGTLNFALFTNAGLNRFGDQINIVGSADRNQLLVQGNLSAQTSDLAYLYTFDTVNNSARPVLRLESRNSTASTGGAAGFGPALSFYAESATNAAYRQQAQIDATWSTATDATRKALLSLYVYDTAQRKVMSALADGTQMTIGLGGQAPSATVGTQVYQNRDIIQFEVRSNATQTTDNARFGDGTNYLSIAKDGTLTLNGTATAYNDLPPNGVTVGAGASAPSFTAYNGNLRAYEFVGAATTKELHMQWQFPHSWKAGSDIEPHVHLYVPNDGTGGVVKFGIEYTWVNIDGVEGATTTVTGTLTVAASAGNLHKVLSFGGIVGTGKTESSVLSVRLYRNPTDAADTFGSSVWLKSADIHHEVEKFGASTAP